MTDEIISKNIRNLTDLIDFLNDAKFIPYKIIKNGTFVNNAIRDCVIILCGNMMPLKFHIQYNIKSKYISIFELDTGFIYKGHEYLYNTDFNYFKAEYNKISESDDNKVEFTFFDSFGNYRCSLFEYFKPSNRDYLEKEQTNTGTKWTYH